MRVLDEGWTHYLEQHENEPVPESAIPDLEKLVSKLDQSVERCADYALKLTDVFERHPETNEQAFQRILVDERLTEPARVWWKEAVEREVGLFVGRALSDAEIGGIFAAGSAGKCKCTAPAIMVQPAGATQTVGQGVNFSVTATGEGLTYQWRKNGAEVPGATGASYTITSVQASDAGSYDVVVTGTCGSVTSAPRRWPCTTPSPASSSRWITPARTKTW
jgi:hypothetical protein